MKKICKKCGREFYVLTSMFGSTKQKYCDKCGKKYNMPTQADLAKRAKRSFIDKVQIEADKADAERLKREATVDDDSTWWIANVDVDNLLKEMESEI